MKKISFLVLAFALLGLCTSAFAQSSHSVSLAWDAPVDSQNGKVGTVNVYKCVGPCTATSTFTLLAGNVTPLGPYVDNTVGIGTDCYYVTLVVAGAESLPSNKVQATIIPAAVTNLKETSQ